MVIELVDVNHQHKLDKNIVEITRVFPSLTIKPIMTWNNFLLSNLVPTIPPIHPCFPSKITKPGPNLAENYPKQKGPTLLKA